MALNWKIYRGREYVGACRYPEDAAALVAVSGGAIKYAGRIVWKEGSEDFPAGESFDHVAEVATKRAREHSVKRWERFHGSQKREV